MAHSPEKQAEVLALLKLGVSVSEISRQVQVGRTTLKRWKGRWEEEGIIGGGKTKRPPKPDPNGPNDPKGPNGPKHDVDKSGQELINDIDREILLLARDNIRGIRVIAQACADAKWIRGQRGSDAAALYERLFAGTVQIFAAQERASQLPAEEYPAGELPGVGERELVDSDQGRPDGPARVQPDPGAAQ